MNTSKFRFTLDLQKTQSQISIPVTLGDTARTWLISFSDGGQPYAIEEVSLAKLEIKRPTGTYMEEFCAIENGTTVRYSFSQNENTALVEGINQCAVILYGTDGEILASPRFTMLVIDRVVAIDDINISDEDQGVIDRIIATEKARVEAETGRVNAEAERHAAELLRQTAETARVEAEKAREQKFSELKTVEANPEGEAPGQLTKVRIDGNVYSTGNAYALAKENNYSGTEADFGKKLAELLALGVYAGESEDVRWILN